jgi:glycosyltransferase involved in cell wall biosynthesis
MNILFFLPEFYPHAGGGISTYYLNYIEAIKHHCDEIRVIVGSGYTQSEEIYNYNGIHVEYLRPEIFKKYISQFPHFDLAPEFQRNLAAAWAMKEQIDASDFQYDLIECADFGLGYVPWLVDKTRPVICRFHGSAGQISFYEDTDLSDLETILNRQVEFSLLPYCERLISQSLANKVFWDNLFGREMVSYLPPIFNKTSLPLPFYDRQMYGLVTARIQKWKGPAELCDALSVLTDNSLLIKWIGNDKTYNHEKTTVQYLSERYPTIWGTRVVASPPLPNAKITKMQRGALYGLVTSTWDIFNFSCIEFMANGTPVICSEGAGASELIEHGVNGFRYSVGDTRGLAECIMELLKMDKAAYTLMANAAYDTIATQLQPDLLAEKNLTMYKALAATNGRVPVPHFVGMLYRPLFKPRAFEQLLNKQPLKKLTAYYFRRLYHKFTESR